MAQVLATNRRAMLRGSAAVLLAAAAAAPALPEPPVDAELLAACTVFAAAAREVARLERAARVPDDVFEPATDALHDAVIRVSGLRARTVGGLCAKARVCRAVLAADEPDVKAARIGGPTRRHDLLAWSVLSNLVELQG